MGNLKDVFYELLAHMDKDQYESFETIHTNILRDRGKKLDNYEQFKSIIAHMIKFQIFT